MTDFLIGLIAIFSTLIYVLIGWFVRTLLQDDWDEPSLLLTILWPLVTIVIGVIKIFEWVGNLATKIKDKYNG